MLDLTEGAGDETFMSVFVRDLIAKTAMIEYIVSHKRHIQTKDGNSGAIYGGAKYTADGVDTDPTGLLGKKGFWLDTNRLLKAGGIQTQGAFNGAVDIVDEMRFYQATGGSLVNRGNLKVGAVAGLIGLIISSGFIACDTMYTKVDTSGSGTENRLIGVV